MSKSITQEPADSGGRPWPKPARRSVAAPDLATRPQGVGGPIDVLLDPDEDVEWTWATTSAGRRHVIGYAIEPKPAKQI